MASFRGGGRGFGDRGSRGSFRGGDRGGRGGGRGGRGGFQTSYGPPDQVLGLTYLCAREWIKGR